MHEAPVWIHLPVAEAERLTATTVHALITGHGEANYLWVACSDCTGLMMEGAYAT